MSVETNYPIVSKFGGTSMARPDLVLSQIEYDKHAPDIVVLSAAGSSELHPTKVTKMLRGFMAGQGFTPDDIQERYLDVLTRSNMLDDSRSLEVVERIPGDIKVWIENDYPIEALGEYWSAKLFAIQSGREFVDAREFIFFKENGELDEELTLAAIRAWFENGKRYAVPGFYGIDANGKVRVLPDGGSDTTGALVAKALSAEYHNWSDVPGIMTANPKIVPEARLLDRVTHREIREFGNAGSEIMQRSVSKYLKGTGVRTIMRNTFAERGNKGTIITDERAWQWKPIVGVTGRDDLISLNLHEFELNDGIGETLDVDRELLVRRVPYEHRHDATDDVATHIDRKYKDEVSAIAEKLQTAERTLSTLPSGLINVIGEGLVQSGTFRFKVMGAVATAFAEAGIVSLGSSDVGASATQTYFVKPEQVPLAISIAHQTLELHRQPKTKF